MQTLDKWAINESLLQAYRSTFISSQSFLLAVGAIISGKGPVLLYGIAAIGLVVIWWIWFPVVRARHLIVDYYKYSSDLDESKLAALCSWHDYVTDRSKRDQANSLFGLERNWRETRLKMDAGMPVLFSFVWVALVVHEACCA